MTPSTQSMNEAMDCLVIYLDPGKHDNLVSIWRIETINQIASALDLRDKIAREEQKEKDAKIAEEKWGMKKFFDNSDPDKWGEYYTARLEEKVDGWNKAKDEIAAAIRRG